MWELLSGESMEDIGIYSLAGGTPALLLMRMTFCVSEPITTLAKWHLLSGLYLNIVWTCIMKQKSIFSTKSWKLQNYNIPCGTTLRPPVVPSQWWIHNPKDRGGCISILYFIALCSSLKILTVKHHMCFPLRRSWIVCAFRPLSCRSGWRFVIQQDNDFEHTARRTQDDLGDNCGYSWLDQPEPWIEANETSLERTWNITDALDQCKCV